MENLSLTLPRGVARKKKGGQIAHKGQDFVKASRARFSALGAKIGKKAGESR